jgi:hypothetical protein
MVKAEADDVILAAGARIGEEIAKVPKSSGGNQKAKLPREVNSRQDAMSSGTQRARYQKLAAAKPKLKAIARKLRDRQRRDAEIERARRLL